LSIFALFTQEIVMSQSFLRSAGQFTGKAAANAVHGTRLGASQFAIGYAEAYAEQRAALKAQREALLFAEPIEVVEPVVAKQRKAAVSTR
jgi:hypothetical protein